MAKEIVTARIRTGSGTELVVESDRETVREIISEIHRREEAKVRFREEFEKRRELERKRYEDLRKKRNEAVHGDIASRISRVRHTTKMDVFMGLIKSGFFRENRSLGDVQMALQEKGYHYPVTSLSPTLLRLVRRGFLVRAKHIHDEKETWVYRAHEGKNG